MGTSSITLDSWAVLAWLQGEPAGKIVRDLILWAGGADACGTHVADLLQMPTSRPELLLNVINLGEVLYILGRRFGLDAAKDTIRDLRSMPLHVMPADDATVLEAASIKVGCRVSYGDAFAVATARANGGALITGDPELRNLPGISVRWIGSRSQ